jgi:hypothetical protein
VRLHCPGIGVGANENVEASLMQAEREPTPAGEDIDCGRTIAVGHPISNRTDVGRIRRQQMAPWSSWDASMMRNGWTPVRLPLDRRARLIRGASVSHGDIRG